MIKKLNDTAPRLTRQQLADPQAGTPYMTRLERSGAVDLRDNKVIEHRNDGYVVIRPIDPQKRFRK